MSDISGTSPMKPRWMRGETKNHMNISDILGTPQADEVTLVN